MKEITLKATVENILQATAFVDEQLESLDCPMKAQMQMDVAVDEIFTNIAHYAYGDQTGDATLRIGEEGGVVTLVFEDSGIPFNPLDAPEPDVSLSAAERPIGGLGIFLVRRTMDSMDYVRTGGKNVLTVRKRIR